MWLFTFSLNLAQKTYKIPTKYNCTYSQRDVLQGLTFISLETAYAESGLKRLTKRLQRANKPKTNYKAPNGDTMRLRLKQISRQEAKTCFANSTGKSYQLQNAKEHSKRKSSLP